MATPRPHYLSLFHRPSLDVVYASSELQNFRRSFPVLECTACLDNRDIGSAGSTDISYEEEVADLAGEHGSGMGFQY